MWTFDKLMVHRGLLYWGAELTEKLLRNNSLIRIAVEVIYLSLQSFPFSTYYCAVNLICKTLELHLANGDRFGICETGLTPQLLALNQKLLNFSCKRIYYRFQTFLV